MKLTTSQMAALCKMTRYGFYKLANNLGIPYQMEHGRAVFDTDSNTHSKFFQSVKLALTDSNLQPFYSIKDIADRRGQCKNTIRTFLLEHDIPIYYSGTKWLVLLVDIQQLASKSSN